mmetsp:Transcript_33129/g.87983  ORF Transcript_33129/g.87983 Transcript_33129/m.87983 type:complete len:198 (+) Transcript_33129:102-695(+)
MRNLPIFPTSIAWTLALVCCLTWANGVRGNSTHDPQAAQAHQTIIQLATKSDIPQIADNNFPTQKASHEDLSLPEGMQNINFHRADRALEESPNAEPDSFSQFFSGLFGSWWHTDAAPQHAEYRHVHEFVHDIPCPDDSLASPHKRLLGIQRPRAASPPARAPLAGPERPGTTAHDRLAPQGVGEPILNDSSARRSP